VVSFSENSSTAQSTIDIGQTAAIRRPDREKLLSIAGSSVGKIVERVRA